MTETAQQSVQVDPQVAAMFNSMNESYANAEANNGEGAQGEWPPEGDHDVLVLGITAKADKMKLSDGMQVPLLIVQFQYELERTRENDPDWHEGKAPLVFKGENFRLIPNAEKISGLTDGQKTAARIQEERFKGHCSKLLRKPKEECVNPGADFAAVAGAIGSGPRMAVSIKVQHREGNVKKKPDGTPVNPNAKAPTYKTEFILERIA